MTPQKPKKSDQRPEALGKAGITVKRIRLAGLEEDDPEYMANITLIDRMYEQLYVRAFPIAAEQLPKATLIDNLKNADNPSALSEMTVSIEGRNLDDPHNAEIYALAIGEYFPKSQTALNFYLAKNPDIRITTEENAKVLVKPGMIFDFEQKRWVGEQVRPKWGLLQDRQEALADAAKRRGRKIMGHFSEANNPNLVPIDEMDGIERFMVMIRMGAAAMVPIDYTQPPINSEICKDMVLLNYTLPNGAIADQQRTEDFLREYYEIYDPTGLCADHLDAMLTQLGSNAPTLSEPTQKALSDFLDAQAQVTARNAQRNGPENPTRDATYPPQ